MVTMKQCKSWAYRPIDHLPHMYPTVDVYIAVENPCCKPLNMIIMIYIYNIY